ncbi:MAG: HD domain-containing protein [Acidimicrobiales bacterium]
MRIAAIDLGSNSFHLLVAEARPDGTFEPLSSDKEMLRLGSLVAATGQVGEEGTAAAVEVMRRFQATAESLGADELVACATAALREAADSAAVVDRIEAATGIAVRVISGREEARLIFDAVRASVVIEPGPALALDLGGGSLELMVGRRRGLVWSTSLKLGVGRLTAELVRSDPPSHGDRRRLVHATTNAVSGVLPEITSRSPRVAIGSSGTLTTLIRLAAGRPTPSQSVNQLRVSLADLQALGDELLAMTAAQRADLPGVDSRRADLLPAGVVVLTTVMELTGLDHLVGCEWAMREGMVLDTIGRHSTSDWIDDPHAIRRDSTLSLCRRCGWNEGHARKVSRLALDLFDGTRPLHDLDEGDRELLEYGGWLHDIGEHVSVEGHERHTAYLIEHGRLRGFSPEEVAELTCLGRFHRRGSPKSSFAPYAGLSGDRRRRVSQLVALLQVADGLDRSHGGPVQAVAVYLNRPGVVEVVVEASDDIDLELWGLRRKRELFERLFDVRLEVVSGQLELSFDDPAVAKSGLARDL